MHVLKSLPAVYEAAAARPVAVYTFRPLTADMRAIVCRGTSSLSPSLLRGSWGALLATGAPMNGLNMENAAVERCSGTIPERAMCVPGHCAQCQLP